MTIEKTSREQKIKTAKSYSTPGRSLNNLAKLTRPNSAPRHEQDSIVKRSEATSKKRALRYSKALRSMASK